MVDDIDDKKSNNKIKTHDTTCSDKHLYRQAYPNIITFNHDQRLLLNILRKNSRIKLYYVSQKYNIDLNSLFLVYDAIASKMRYSSILNTTHFNRVMIYFHVKYGELFNVNNILALNLFNFLKCHVNVNSLYFTSYDRYYNKKLRYAVDKSYYDIHTGICLECIFTSKDQYFRFIELLSGFNISKMNILSVEEIIKFEDLII